MRPICVAAAVLLAALLPASPAAAWQTKAQERLEDLNALCDALERGHANLYAHMSREDFEAKRREIAGRLDGMSDGAFYYALRELAASAGDAHTTIDYRDSRYAHLRALPFAVVWMECKWYLAMVSEEDRAYLGWEVAAIPPSGGRCATRWRR